VKLLLNLVVTAINAVPRGGSVSVTVAGDAEQCEFILKSKGLNARIPPHAEVLLAGSPENGTVDAHGIQTFYAGMIARAAGMGVRLGLEGDEVTIRASTAID
jgi:histidine phosphotransferase ChpT